MPKNKQSDLIASVKLLNIRSSTNINSGIGGGGYSVLLNYQSLLSDIFPLAPLPQLFFSIYYSIDEIDC